MSWRGNQIQTNPTTEEELEKLAGPNRQRRSVGDHLSQRELDRLLGEREPRCGPMRHIARLSPDSRAYEAIPRYLH